MITLITIGIIIFSIKAAGLALRAAWGITKSILFVVGLPLIMIGLLVTGIVTLAIPLLILALLGVFLFPILKVF